MVAAISMLWEWILLTSLLHLIFLRENNNHILLKEYFQSYNGISSIERTLTQRYRMALRQSTGKYFHTLKKMCVNTNVSAYYSKTKPIVFMVDSSSKGLGAAIMQEGKQWSMRHAH